MVLLGGGEHGEWFDEERVSILWDEKTVELCYNNNVNAVDTTELHR